MVASDLGVGSLPAYARVNVRVLDVNDNAPVVLVNPLTESGRVEVTENAAAPGAATFAAYVAVRDADSGKNGAAECHVTAGTDTTTPAAGKRCSHFMPTTFYVRVVCLGGVMVRAFDLRLTGREFDPRPWRYRPCFGQAAHTHVYHLSLIHI